MSDKRLRSGEMSSAFGEASELIRAIGFDEELNKKGRIARAARILGVGFNRAKDIWYGAAARIDSDEMDELRRVASEIRAERASKQAAEDAEREAHGEAEFRELERRVAFLESCLAAMGQAQPH